MCPLNVVADYVKSYIDEDNQVILPWVVGSYATDPSQRYYYKNVVNAELSYTYTAPNASVNNPILLTDSPEGNSEWLRWEATPYDVSAIEAELIGPDASIYPDRSDLVASTETYNSVPSGTTHLRLAVGSSTQLFMFLPVVSGTISSITYDGDMPTQAVIGGSTVHLTSVTISELKSVAIANNTSVDNVAFLFDEAVLSGQEYLRVAGEEKTYFVADGITGTVSNVGSDANGIRTISTVSNGNFVARDTKLILPSGWSVYKSVNDWVAESNIDTGFTSLQAAIDFAVANGEILELNGGVYNLTERLTKSDNLTVYVKRPTTINFDPSIDATDLGLFESTNGELHIFGAKLTIDANNNTSNGAIISSLQKYIKADNIIELVNLPNGSAYFASEQVNTNGTEMSGQGWFKALKTDNVSNGAMVYGNNLWWDESLDIESSFELGGDCVIKCSGSYAYLMNKLLHARVGGCLIKDSGGYYKSFSTNLENGDWTASSSTLSLNTITTTTSGGAYTTIDELVVGEDYFVVFGGSTTASALEIRNGTSGTSPLITNSLGRVQRFTAESKSIYLRNLGAGVTQITDFAVFKESSTSSNIFQCASADIEGTRYIGTRRGPVIGIDCKNFTVRATKTLGFSLTGLDIDIESLPNQPQLYPDAYGIVFGNLCKYGAQRGWYSTARRLDVINNSFYYCSDTSESTTSATMRFNTRNETESTSNIVLHGNKAVGCNSVPFVSVYRGKIRIGSGNTHDSTSVLPYTTDRSGDSGSDYAAIEYLSNGSGVRSLTSSSFTVRPGDTISRVDDLSLANVNLPNRNFAGCEGFSGKVARGDNTNAINVSTTVGTINGSTTYNWPASDRILDFISISDENDYIVSSY